MLTDGGLLVSADGAVSTPSDGATAVSTPPDGAVTTDDRREIVALEFILEARRRGILLLFYRASDVKVSIICTARDE
jgi:hypothetical protein